MRRTRYSSTHTSEQVALEMFRSDAYLVLNKSLLMRYGPARTVFLENLIDKYKYWRERDMLQEDGSFFLTHKAQRETTGLTEYQIRAAKQTFIDEGVLMTAWKGIPAKEHYILNFDRLLEVLFDATPTENRRACPNETTRACPSKTVELALTKSPGLALTKSPGLALTKSPGLYKNNKDKNNKDKNNKERSLSHTSSKGDKLQEYLPIAQKLADIVQSHKNVQISPTKLRSWADSIRKLVSTDGVAIERIEQALDWYSDNIGGAYIPVIESGTSLRDKFIRLEDAIKRSSQAQGSPAAPLIASPKHVIHKHLGKTIGKVFFAQCYEPALDLFEFGDEDSASASLLATTLITFYDQLQQAANDKMSHLLPSVLTIISDYISWIRENDWIRNLSMQMFDINHPLFKRFRRDEARKDNEERDPLTGKSYMRD
jgi:hypothetical protein